MRTVPSAHDGQPIVPFVLRLYARRQVFIDVLADHLHGYGGPAQSTPPASKRAMMELVRTGLRLWGVGGVQQESDECDSGREDDPGWQTARHDAEAYIDEHFPELTKGTEPP